MNNAAMHSNSDGANDSESARSTESEKISWDDYEQLCFEEQVLQFRKLSSSYHQRLVKKKEEEMKFCEEDFCKMNLYQHRSLIVAKKVELDTIGALLEAYRNGYEEGKKNADINKKRKIKGSSCMV